MNFRKLFMVLVATTFATPLFGFESDRLDPIKKLLFPPELIMQHRSQLNLDDEQQEIIKLELQGAQTAVFDLRWQMKDESEHLAELLQMRPIDEAELLEQADRVMALEKQIKTSHLTMLVRLKNMLSDQQIELLGELRKARPSDRKRPDQR